MIRHLQRPYLSRTTIGAVAVCAVILLPMSYVAGWLHEAGQARPALSKLNHLEEGLALQQARLPQEPPKAMPASLAFSVGAAHVTLTWSQVKGATRFTVYRATGTEGFSSARAVGHVDQEGHQVAFIDTTVKPGQVYSYWIAPENGAGQGPMTSAETVHTYETWETIAKSGQAGAVPSEASRWTQGGWGLLPAHHTTTSPLVVNIGNRTYGLFSFPQGANTSTWMTHKWTTWTVNHKKLAVSSVHQGLSELKPTPHGLTALVPGSLTGSNLALWWSHGDWHQEVVSRGLQTWPTNAIILNRYGQAAGLTNAQGARVSVVTERS